MKVIAYFVLRDAAETTLAKGKAGLGFHVLALRLQCGSETEGGLQIDAANGYSGGEGPAEKTIVFAEERRSQDAARIGKVHLVEHVAG